LAIVAAQDVDLVLSAMKSHPLGQHAAVIGEVTSDHPGFVMMKTRIGGIRVANVDFDLPDPAKARAFDDLRKSFDQEVKGCEWHGDNPEVFQYAICDE